MTDLERLRDVWKRSKGWPVGIPAPPAQARRLVAKGLARWAPPMYAYPKPVFAIALTGMGRAKLGV